MKSSVSCHEPGPQPQPPLTAKSHSHQPQPPLTAFRLVRKLHPAKSGIGKPFCIPWNSSRILGEFVRYLRPSSAYIILRASWLDCAQGARHVFFEISVFFLAKLVPKAISYKVERIILVRKLHPPQTGIWEPFCIPGNSSRILGECVMYLRPSPASFQGLPGWIWRRAPDNFPRFLQF